MSQTRVTAQYYLPTPPSPVPRAASKFLFNAHPAKHAAIKYKMKLITNSGVAKPLPIPKAIAAARWKECGSLMSTADLSEDSDGFRCKSECAPQSYTSPNMSQLLTPPSLRSRVACVGQAAMSLLSRCRNFVDCPPSVPSCTIEPVRIPIFGKCAFSHRSPPDCVPSSIMIP